MRDKLKLVIDHFCVAFYMCLKKFTIMQNLSYEKKFDFDLKNEFTGGIRFHMHCFAPRVVLIQSGMYKTTQEWPTIFTSEIHFFE